MSFFVLSFTHKCFSSIKIRIYHIMVFTTFTILLLGIPCYKLKCIHFVNKFHCMVAGPWRKVEDRTP